MIIVFILVGLINCETQTPQIQFVPQKKQTISQVDTEQEPSPFREEFEGELQSAVSGSVALLDEPQSIQERVNNNTLSEYRITATRSHS
jgi:hypothetical protein